jgi:hypothetical protein
VRKSEKDFPLTMYSDITKQIPSLRRKFSTYDSYKDKSIDQLFTAEQLKIAKTLECTFPESSVFVNQGGKSFKCLVLPAEAQFSKIYSILVTDFNSDSKPDLILGGNDKMAKPEIGIQNSSYGIALAGNGDGTFAAMKQFSSGFYVHGEIRDMKELQLDNRQYIFVLVNNDSVNVFRK